VRWTNTDASEEHVASIFADSLRSWRRRGGGVSL